MPHAILALFSCFMRRGSCCVDREAALASRVLGSAMERCFLPLPRHPPPLQSPPSCSLMLPLRPAPQRAHIQIWLCQYQSCHLGLRPPSPLTPASQMYCPLDSPKGSQAQLFLYPNLCLSLLWCLGAWQTQPWLLKQCFS